jgi:hypothetical protein
MYSVVSGSLPFGLVLAANGLLSGSPVESGEFSFSVRASDANLAAAERQYSIAISNCVTLPLVMRNH